MKTVFTLLVIVCVPMFAQEVCQVANPTATFTVHHEKGSPEISADSSAALWKKAAKATIVKDCTHVVDYPELDSEVRGFWDGSRFISAVPLSL
jgi:hypothetical protein